MPGHARKSKVTFPKAIRGIIDAMLHIPAKGQEEDGEVTGSANSPGMEPWQQLRSVLQRW